MAIPVLLLGEFCAAKIAALRWTNVPAPVVGGLLVALAVLLFRPVFTIEFATKINASWLTRIFSTEAEWKEGAQQSLILPFMVAFFTCLGLNASWKLVKQGGVQVVVVLMLGLLLGVVQNLVGAGLAFMFHLQPLMGLVCGSITLLGGPSTALGFAPLLEENGLHDAGLFGVAAATFGIVTSSLIGGPVATALIRARGLAEAVLSEDDSKVMQARAGILPDLGALRLFGLHVILPVIILLICFKAGASLGAMVTYWMTFLPKFFQLKFPVYMGAMVCGILVRNIHDTLGLPFLKNQVIETLGSIMLKFALAIALMSLDLHKLVSTAGPMLAILTVQVVIMVLFAWLIFFMILGRTYEAAVMTGGFIGFGLGITANAVANMKSLVERYGPAPQAFLVVPIVGAFLIDIVNSFNITWFVNFLK